jgi:hypothetical protein
MASTGHALVPIDLDVLFGFGNDLVLAFEKLADLRSA